MYILHMYKYSYKWIFLNHSGGWLDFWERASSSLSLDSFFHEISHIYDLSLISHSIHLTIKRHTHEFTHFVLGEMQLHRFLTALKRQGKTPEKCPSPSLISSFASLLKKPGLISRASGWIFKETDTDFLTLLLLFQGWKPNLLSKKKKKRLFIHTNEAKIVFMITAQWVVPGTAKTLHVWWIYSMVSSSRGFTALLKDTRTLGGGWTHTDGQMEPEALRALADELNSSSMKTGTEVAPDQIRWEHWSLFDLWACPRCVDVHVCAQLDTI